MAVKKDLIAIRMQDEWKRHIENEFHFQYYAAGACGQTSSPPIARFSHRKARNQL
jgi:hypothetical protein